MRTVSNRMQPSGAAKVSRKDLHEKLWESRSFEIKHLWQRSIFLATFIVALFTLYFGVLDTYYTELSNCESEETTADVDSYNSDSSYESQIFRLLEIICISGFSFSVLWICMARGSKYMYERHERGIDEFYQRESFDEELSLKISLEFYEVLWSSGDYTYIPRHGALPLSDYDYRMLHLKGGKFSSSKINIAIGYIFSSAWIFLTFISGILIYNAVAPFSIVAIGLEIFIAFIIGFNVLSDNQMMILDYCKLVWKTTYLHKKKEQMISPDFNQQKWIFSTLNSLKYSESSYIWTHVNTIMRQYCKICDNPLQRYIIDCFFNQRYECCAFRWLQSNEYLWHLFSTALMYRNLFSTAFHGCWINPRCPHNYIKIWSNGIRIHLGGFDKYCYLKAKVNIRQQEETRLFADTDWHRIRSGYLDYDLIEDARCQHLIWKEVNGDTLYMTMDISPSISDLEFYYHRLNNDIDNSELIRMKVSIIWKDKKYEYTLFRS